MLQNIIFLSKGLQIALFVIMIFIILIFSRISSLQDEIRHLEKRQSQFITHDNFSKFFRKLWIDMSLKSSDQ